jgi:hypothetical protein
VSTNNFKNNIRRFVSVNKVREGSATAFVKMIAENAQAVDALFRGIALVASGTCYFAPSKNGDLLIFEQFSSKKYPHGRATFPARELKDGKLRFVVYERRALEPFAVRDGKAVNQETGLPIRWDNTKRVDLDESEWTLYHWAVEVHTGKVAVIGGDAAMWTKAQAAFTASTLRRQGKKSADIAAWFEIPVIARNSNYRSVRTLELEAAMPAQ